MMGRGGVQADVKLLDQTPLLGHKLLGIHDVLLVRAKQQLLCVVNTTPVSDTISLC